MHHDAQVIAGIAVLPANLVLRPLRYEDVDEELPLLGRHQLQRSPDDLGLFTAHDQLLDVEIESRDVHAVVVELVLLGIDAVALEHDVVAGAEDECAQALRRLNSIRHPQLREKARERLLNDVVPIRLREPGLEQLDRQLRGEVRDEVVHGHRIRVAKTAQILRVKWVAVHVRSSGVPWYSVDGNEVTDYGVTAAWNSRPLLGTRAHVLHLW